MLKQWQPAILNNLFWFVASLVLAMIVWFVATIEANPVEERTFRRVPISVLTSEDMIITSQSSTVADVDVVAQETVISALQADDMTLTVDLREQAAGVHNEDIAVDISRPANADTRPLRISVTLEQEMAQQVPIDITVSGLQVGLTASVPERDVFQAQVEGASVAVNQVARVVGDFDLSSQQSAQIIERNLTLVAVDADGNPVNNVTIDPASILVSVDVSQREDVATFTIRPDILFTTLPENYEFRNVEYTPDTIILTGPPDLLASLGDTIDTEPISLANQTTDFTVDVNLDLPDDPDLFVLSETRTITVTVSVSEETTTLPLEDIPVRIIGLPDGIQATANPQTVSVVLAGPVSQIADLTSDDIQAVVDVNGLEAGQYELVPQIDVLQAQVQLGTTDITFFPAQITVVIVAPEVTPQVESTSEIDPSPQVETTPASDPTDASDDD